MTIIVLGYSQAKKPTMMVIPDNTWCQENGFMNTVDNQGQTEYLPNYEVALLNSSDLKIVISTLGGLMQDRGFTLKDLSQVISAIKLSQAEDIARTSKSGDDVAISNMDRLTERAKCDIILRVYWKFNSMGPRRSITYTLEAIDAYTNKSIASTTGTGTPSMTSELALLLQKAVEQQIEEFNGRLMAYFTDMANKGREVSLVIKKWENSPVDLETEKGGKELNEIIENWVSDNTVAHSYSLADATENKMEFEQVRIPLYINDKAVDTRMWARGLVHYLKDIGIDSKLEMRGLGRATIILGGK